MLKAVPVAVGANIGFGGSDVFCVPKDIGTADAAGDEKPN